MNEESSKDSVLALVTKLAEAFICKPARLYPVVDVCKQRKSIAALRRKAFDKILFDYPDAFDSDETIHSLEEFVCQLNSVGRKSDADALMKVVSREKSNEDDIILKACAYMLPLSTVVKNEVKPVLGYGSVTDAVHKLDDNILQEANVFSNLAMFAPDNLTRYDYFDNSVFTTAVRSVTDTDSAFSECSSSPLDQSESTIMRHDMMYNEDIFNCKPGSAGLSGVIFGHKSAAMGSREKIMSSSLYGALTNSICQEIEGSCLQFPDIPPEPPEFIPNLSERFQQLQNMQKTEVSSADEGFHSPKKEEELAEVITEEPAASDDFRPLSWELQRKPGGYVMVNVIEKPYLTEAGPTVFDRLFRLHVQCASRVDSSVSVPQLYVISLRDLMRDVARLLLGASSKCFLFDNETQRFMILPGLTVSGLSSNSLASVCDPLVTAGTYYYRLHRLSYQTKIEGLTVNAFLKTIRSYLHMYSACVLHISRQARSPLHLNSLMGRQLQQLRFVAELSCSDGPTLPNYPPINLLSGMDLLMFLYNKTWECSCHYMFTLVLHILHYTCQPYLIFLQEWVYHGHCSDIYGEFLVSVDPSQLCQRDRKFWTHGYQLSEQYTGSCFLLGSMAQSVFTCGKSLSLLCAVAQEHPLCCVYADLPPISLVYSELLLSSAETACSVYEAKIRAMIKHRLYDRRKIQEEKMEERRKLLRYIATKHADRVTMLQQKLEQQRREADIKKRELFAEMKANMEKAVNDKLAETEAEKAMDADLVDALSKREQLQTEADRRLEQEAREELIAYYRVLSEGAALRERQALWRIRRHQLDEKRGTWMQDREEEIRQALEEIASSGVRENDSKQVQVQRAKWAPPASLDIREESAWVKPEKIILKIQENEDEPETTAHELSKSINQSDTVGVLFNQSEDVAKSFTEFTPSIKIEAPERITLETEEENRRLSIQLADMTSATTETEQQPTASAIKTYEQNPGLQQTTQRTTVSSIKVFDSSHATLETEQKEFIRRRSEWGHASDTSTRSHALLLHRLGKVDGRHVNETTFNKDFLVKSKPRKRDPNELSPQKERRSAVRRLAGLHATNESEIDRDTADENRLWQLRGQTSRKHASQESLGHDDDLIRLNKFKMFNKQGHASDSTIQKILYKGKYEQLPADEIDEREFPPIMPADVGEGGSEYDNYNDVFSEMSSLAQNVTKFDLLDETLQSDDADILLFDHMSLPNLLHQSVVKPIKTQITLVNESILGYYMIDLEINKHFGVLQQYLLMARGEFSQAFTNAVFDKLHDTRYNKSLISCYTVNDVLRTSMQLGSPPDQHLLRNISLLLNQPPAHLTPHSLSALDWLKLVYKVEWPLNIIIDSTQIEKYSRIFSFLLRIKHVSYVLGDIWLLLKRANSIHKAGTSEHFRSLHMYRHDMQHFAKVLHSYIAIQVTQVAWRKFQTDLETKVKDLDQLYECHDKFLRNCLSRCFLTPKLKSIMQIVEGTLKSVLKFHALLSTGMWNGGNSDGEELTHSEFAAISQAYMPFKEYTRFLNKVLGRMTLNDKQPHLKEFQLMLNYSGYYGK